MKLGFWLEDRWSWKLKLVPIARILLGEFLDS
jgi:hypothetical protein